MQPVLDHEAMKQQTACDSISIEVLHWYIWFFALQCTSLLLYREGYAPYVDIESSRSLITTYMYWWLRGSGSQIGDQSGVDKIAYVSACVPSAPRLLTGLPWSGKMHLYSLVIIVKPYADNWQLTRVHLQASGRNHCEQGQGRTGHWTAHETGTGPQNRDDCTDYTDRRCGDKHFKCWNHGRWHGHWLNWGRPGPSKTRRLPRLEKKRLAQCHRQLSGLSQWSPGSQYYQYLVTIFRRLFYRICTVYAHRSISFSLSDTCQSSIPMYKLLYI